MSKSNRFKANKQSPRELTLAAVKATKPRAFAVKGGVQVHENKRRKADRVLVRQEARGY